MADQDVRVGVEVDAGAAASGSDEAVSAIERIIEAITHLKQAAQESGDAQKAGAESSASMSSSMQAMGGVVEGLVAGLGALVGTVAAAFTVDKIIDFAEMIGETAQEFDHLSQRLGMTTAEINQLDSIAKMSNTSVEALALGIGRMDVALKNAREGSDRAKDAFKQLGINVNEDMSQMELLRKISDSMANMANGPEKTALAIQVLGRAGAQLIPVLNLGSQGLDEMLARLARYSLDAGTATERTDQMQEKAKELGEAFDEQKVAMKGLQQVIADALSPAVTDIVRGLNDATAAFIKNYREGGTVAQVFKIIAESVSGLWQVLQAAISALGTVIQGLIDVVNDLGGSFGVTAKKGDLVTFILGEIGRITKEAAIGMIQFGHDVVDAMLWIDQAIKQAQAAFVAMWEVAQSVFRNIQAIALDTGKVILASMTGNVGAAAAAMSDDAKHIAAVHNDTVAAIQKGQAAWTKAEQDGVNARYANRQRENDDINMTLVRLQQASDRMHKIFEDLGKGTGGTSKPTPAGTGKEKSDMEKFRAELEKLEQDTLTDSGAWLQDMTALELKFWAEKLTHATKGTKDYYAIYKQVFDLTRKVHQDEQSEQLETDKANLAEVKANHEKSEAAWEVYLGHLAAFYTKDSREYRKALDDKERADRAYEIEQERALTARIAQQQAADRALLSTQMATHDVERQMTQDLINQDLAQRQIGARQWYAESLALVRERYAEERALAEQAFRDQHAILERQLADVEREHGRESEQYKAVRDQMAQLDRQYNADELLRLRKLTADEVALRRQAAAEMTATMGRFITTMTSSFGNAIHGLIMMTTTWHDAFIGILDSMLQFFINYLAELLAKQLISALTSVASKKLEAVKNISTASGEAFANTYASISAIPVWGPFAAPEMAAAAAAAARAGGMAQLIAEQGVWEVPGVTPALLHPKESVLPAWAAEPMRKSVERGHGLGGGDTYHVSIHAMDGRSVERVLRSNGGKLVKVLGEQVRAGAVAGRF